MDRNELLQLMHVVLDRTATDAQRAALDRVLAADPAAHAEFEREERLFGALAAMSAEPPAGFVDDVMAALQCNTTTASPSHQPFSQSGVIAPMGSDIRVRAPLKPITARTPSGPIRGRQDMSKRGLWIIGGVAAAVMALFVGNAIDFPASGDKAAGTIVPAERHRGVQPNAADVKLVDPSRRPSPGVPLAIDNSGLNAAGSALNSSGAGMDAAAKTAQQNAGMDAASKTAQQNAGMDAAAKTAQQNAGMDAASKTAQQNAGMDAAAKKSQQNAGMDAAAKTAQQNAGMDAAAKKSQQNAGMDATAKTAQQNAGMDARAKK